MSAVPAPDSPAPIGLRAAFRSWLQAWSGETRLPSAGPARAASAPIAHCYGPVRVLVVDDNPQNLVEMSALLASRGLVPMLAADGAEAVALACELPFDLILMDLQMPILDGLGATAAIRRFETQHLRPAVPIVAYSGMSVGACLLATLGMSASLCKPCEDQDLEACLVQWCPAYRPATKPRASEARATGAAAVQAAAPG